MVSMTKKNLKVTFEGYGIFVKVENKAKGITGFGKNTKVNKHDRAVYKETRLVREKKWEIALACEVKKYYQE